MIFASLIPLALIAISSGASTASAGTIESACAAGQHCVYGPPSANRIGPVNVVAGQGRVLQSAFNGAGAGIWLLSKGAAGHIDVHCKKSSSLELFYWYLDQKGGVNKLVSADTNTGVANVHWGNSGSTKGGNEVQSTGAGADIRIDCP